jgi:trimethylamine:corrinoid methyltransferase-like protein
MSTKPIRSPLTVEHLHAVDAATCQQTLAESDIEYSVDMGGFTVHHGTRSGAPIVVAENSNRQPGQLSAVWYD